MTWQCEVIADRTGKWIGNHMTFATQEEAVAYAEALAQRWKLVRDWRVLECNAAVNQKFVNGKSKPVKLRSD